MSKSWIPRMAIALVVMVAIVLAGQWQAAGKAHVAEGTVRIGWVPAASWTPWATLADELPADTKVELVPFKSSNDELTALSTGSIDMAPVGYNNVAALLTSGNPQVTFVSGISSHGSVFLARSGSDIKTWNDLRGKRIGSVRGSTQYVNIATAMSSRGMNIDTDTTYVNMQAFPDLNLALQRGDVDAVVTFPPLSGNIIAGGYGEVVTDIQADLYSGSFTVASGILANNSFLAAHRTDAATVLGAYHRRIDALSKDPVEWAKQFDTISGTKANGIADALRAKYIEPEPNMPMSEILKVPTVLSTMHIIDRDTGVELRQHIDYSLLEQVTGKSAGQLGADK